MIYDITIDIVIKYNHNHDVLIYRWDTIEEGSTIISNLVLHVYNNMYMSIFNIFSDTIL